MILPNELAASLEAVLNETTFSEPLKFRVRSYAAFLDTRADVEAVENTAEKDYENVIPVMVDSPTTESEPIKGAGIMYQSYVISFYFPIKYKKEIIDYIGLLSEHYVGLCERDEETNARSAYNLEGMVFGQVSNQTMSQFKDDMSSWFHQTVQRTEKWAVYQTTLHITTDNGTGKLFMGNDVSYSLSWISESNSTFDIHFKRADGSLTLENSLSGQQLIGASNTENIVSATAESFSLTAYVTWESDWKELLGYWQSKTLNDHDFTLVISLSNGEDSIELSRSVLVQSISLSATIGDYTSATLAFVDREE